MRPNFPKVVNPELDKVLIVLRQVLSRVNLDNIQNITISGTTDPTPNTQRIFPHGMNPRPWIGLPVTQDGGVYVANISDKWVDIRSTNGSSTFSMILLG